MLKLFSGPRKPPAVRDRPRRVRVDHAERRGALRVPRFPQHLGQQGRDDEAGRGDDDEDHAPAQTGGEHLRREDRRQRQAEQRHAALLQTLVQSAPARLRGHGDGGKRRRRIAAFEQAEERARHDEEGHAPGEAGDAAEERVEKHRPDQNLAMAPDVSEASEDDRERAPGDRGETGQRPDGAGIEAEVGGNRVPQRADDEAVHPDQTEAEAEQQDDLPFVVGVPALGVETASTCRHPAVLQISNQRGDV